MAARKRATSSGLITTGSFLACLPAGMTSSITQRPLECDGVEEPQGRHCDDDGTGGKMPLIDEVQQIGPDLGWPEMLGGFAEVAGEPRHLLSIGALCVRGEIADLHLIDHVTAKRMHR